MISPCLFLVSPFNVIRGILCQTERMRLSETYIRGITQIGILRPFSSFLLLFPFLSPSSSALSPPIFDSREASL
jgi:hypothetical protein